MNKFNAHKCFIDGKEFASKHEADRYLILKDRQKRGEIYGLECQKRFTIIEPQTIGKKKVRASEYVADFVYYEAWNQKMTVEDAKGYKKGAAYQLYVLKKKLLLQKYGLWVHEV